jgi:hypothetical protein
MSNKPESWNPKDFEPLDFIAEPTGQLTIFWIDIEPPDPDDFSSIPEFESAWKQWELTNR